MATDTEDKVDNDLQKLCRHLSSKKVTPLAGLPKDMANNTLLAKALAKGLIQVGRRNHTQTIKECRPVKDHGKPVYDEQRRQVLDKEMAIQLCNDWSWTSLDKPHHKPFAELLEEENELICPEVALHVRLTTAGLAAA